MIDGSTTRERACAALKEAAKRDDKPITIWSELHGISRRVLYSDYDGINTETARKVCELTGCDANWLIGVNR